MALLALYKCASIAILLTLLTEYTQSLAYRRVTVDLGHLVSPKFSSDWAVEVTGGSSAADRLAGQHGFINLGQIGNLENFYHFKLVLESDIADSNNLTKGDDHQVTTRSIGALKIVSEQPHLTYQLQQRIEVGFVEQQRITKHSRMDIYSSPTDPLWSDQWSMLNTGQLESPRGKDLNIEPVWMQGVTGRGVVVAFMDNGLEHTHLDLSVNYDPKASWDFVNNDGDPTPDNYYGDDPDSHGTSCAGQVGMVKDNGHCGVGIAHNSRIGGLKIDYNHMTDVIEANSFGHSHNHIDVHSNSWGPIPYGFSVSGPLTLARRALETGVTKGRHGKGVIYTFAGGNGGDNFDSCAANGYASSIYTIAVGSAAQDGMQAFYDEQCAAKMVVTFAFNSEYWPVDEHKQITTTTLNGDCTDTFTGTSSSTPHMSGVIALALQANPNLSWRDVQYLVAYTSNPDSLLDGEWTTNGGGLKVSHKFGFGAVDAEAFVTRARRWINVPEQQSQSYYPAESTNYDIVDDWSTTFDISTSRISFLEHVVLTTSLTVSHSLDESIDYDYIQNNVDYYDGDYSKLCADVRNYGYPKRGDIQIKLTSPYGAVSTMLPYRDNDIINEEGYDSWPFMSVHHWGENPVGHWTVHISYNGSSSGSVTASVLELTLYGTSETPQAVSNIPTTCNPACARGCSGPTTLDCDACQEYRISSTLDCVSTCPNDTVEIHNGYCLDGSTPTPVPKQHETNHMLIIIASAAGGGALLLLIVVCLICCVCLAVCCRRKRPRAQGFVQLPPDDPSPISV